MPMTAAERAKRYRDGKRDERHEDASVTDTISVTELAELGVGIIGPRDVYSEHRWAYLQSRGHVWDTDRQRSFRPDGIMGVTVPGDPAYNGVCSVGANADVVV